MSAKELDNPQIAERIFEQTNETKRISIRRSSNFLKTNYIFAIIINNQIVIKSRRLIENYLAIERLMFQPPIVSDPKYKRRSWSGSGVHGTWERLKRRNTSEDTSVTWPLESIKIRVSISMTRRIPPRISPRLYPFLSQICARLYEPMARRSIDIIVPVDTRRNIFHASLSLSLHAKRCNRVFPHHDTLKRCQVLDDGHSLPWPGHTGRQDIVHYRRALVCFSPSLRPNSPLLLSLPFSPPGISHASPPGFLFLLQLFSFDFRASRIRDGN